NWSNSGTIAGSGGGNLSLTSVTTSTWTNSGSISMIGGGTLTIGGNWSNSGTISETSSTVNLGGSFSLAQLTGFGRSGGSVNLTGTLNNTGTTLALDATTGSWNLVGGTINGGTVTMTGGARLIATTSGGGLAGGVVLTGDPSQSKPLVLDMTSGNGANVTVSGGLTVNNGTIAMGNSVGGYAALMFAGAASTFGGTNAHVSFSNLSNSVYNVVQQNTAGGTLTIGPGVTIHGGSGSVGYNSNYGGPSNVTLVNQGAILADSAGTISVNGVNWTNSGTIAASGGGNLSLTSVTTSTWANSGSISITGGGSLALGGNWSNSGTISETNSTANLGGTFTLAQLGGFSRSGGSVNLVGTLNNTGTTLALDATTGSWNLVGGTISGGSVTATGGARLYATGSGGGLSGGVVLTGDVSLTQPIVLDMSVGNNANVTVSGGLTVNNGTIAMGNSTGGYAALMFAGAASTFDGTNAQVTFSNLSNSVYNVVQQNTAGGTLTIGPGVTIHGGSGSVGYNANYGGPSNVTLVNQG
ncbi:MAG TPA: hypothetical protein PLV92_21890, partial [Pirellulaceae bacterium]|nr:hypothetical protein [Pirellulaceae bacterium]